MQAVRDTTEAAIMAVQVMEIPVNTTRPVLTMPQTNILVVKQPTFDWKSLDKSLDICNFENNVENIILTNRYNKLKGKMVTIIVNSLGHVELRFVQTLKDTEKDKCRSTELFKVFKPQHNDTILSYKIAS